MSGTLHLALRHAAARPGRTIVLVLCIACAIAVPLAASMLLARYESSLRARAATTPLVAGAAGSRFDLAFNALWFRPSRLDPVPYALHLELDADPELRSIPVHARFRARGEPVVAVPPEYLEFRDLPVAAGEPPLLLGDAALGASVARRLGLGVGDRLATEPRDNFYDIAQPATIRLRIVGVFAATGTPDDDAVFVDLRTGWLLDGLLHGHDDAATTLDEADVLVRSGEHVTVAPTMIEAQEVTDANAGDFHLHGRIEDAPISAVILLPTSDDPVRTTTIVRSRIDARPDRQAILPGRVFDELLDFAFRIKRLVDALAIVLGATTALLVGLVSYLSIRARADELRTLHAIGCARGITVRLVAWELAAVLVAGSALAYGLARLAAIAARGLLGT